ncbi:MAG: hypothetical protein HYZ32_03370, partial [Hydrocarboniphaga effusa]|nr:hypothetical protein [Hydrocarboniphaga effusa]
KGLIQDHVDHTGSKWAQQILSDWRDYVGKFWLVKPKATELATLLNTMKQAA